MQPSLRLDEESVETGEGAAFEEGDRTGKGYDVAADGDTIFGREPRHLVVTGNHQRLDRAEHLDAADLDPLVVHDCRNPFEQVLTAIDRADQNLSLCVPCPFRIHAMKIAESMNPPAKQLIDPFGRRHDYLRVSVTDRCNLRCLYCMPCEEEIEWVRRDDLLSFEEIERVVTTLVAAGIRKVRITGGEPFARSGVTDLLGRLRRIDRLESLAVTTNGILLADRLPELRNVVDAFNISLDTFSRERFLKLTGRDRLEDVMRGIETALGAGYRNLKVNCVVMRGINEDEIGEFAAFAAEHPLSVRFIEFMPFAGNAWSEGRIVPMDEILAEVSQDWQLERIPDGPAPISRDFRLVDRRTGRQGRGTIGVIASMSTPFCSTCSRLRLTAEGKIMPCLHSPLEFDLRTVLRSGGSDADILALVGHALSSKPEEHPPTSEMATPSGRVMIQIGG